MSPSRAVAKGVAAELLRAEMTLLDPAVRRDRDRVASLLAIDFFEVGASGRIWTRDQILDLLATDEYSPPVLEDFACHRIADNVVLVTYRTVRMNKVTGQREAALRSSLWSKMSGARSKGSGVWLVRFHQGTRAS
jgi:ribonuclease HI